MARKKIDLGEHFSKHLHDILLYPKAAIRHILKEDSNTMGLWVPAFVVVGAAILTSLGGAIWSIIITDSTLIGLMEVAKFYLSFVVLPFWYLSLWIVWALVIHFMASVYTGKDITNWDVFYRTMKVVGIAWAPLFLNILPFFVRITWFWWIYLVFWGVKYNYGASKKIAFIVIFPALFIEVLKLYTLLASL
ncbi:TPA: YIP1 family protein [archaeon]|jgi:hypothetical protein|uniref:YIP1 family protein n=1 Tax=Candidatus Undinarchaeum marinum TaxID=2756141 RepID=A0A832XHM3_9ARCH|nr:YIP1 family protein [Candidatus Undinarchaeum marinum]